MEFSQHGEFRLFVQGRLLFVEVTGPWNLEMIQAYSEQVGPLARKMAQAGPWVLISIAKQSVLFTPEAIQSLRQTALAHVRQLNRVATAYVVAPSIEGYRLVDAIFEEVYADVCPVAVFDTYQEAERWAEMMLLQQRTVGGQA